MVTRTLLLGLSWPSRVHCTTCAQGAAGVMFLEHGSSPQKPFSLPASVYRPALNTLGSPVIRPRPVSQPSALGHIRSPPPSPSRGVSSALHAFRSSQPASTQVPGHMPSIPEGEGRELTAEEASGWDGPALDPLLFGFSCPLRTYIQGTSRTLAIGSPKARCG